MLNNEGDYKPLSAFTPKQQSLLKRFIHTNLPVYIKVIEQMIEFQDTEDSTLYTTTITVGCFVVVRDEQVIDKYVVQLRPFYVRNEYELTTLTDIINSLLSEPVPFGLDSSDLDLEVAYES